jgi:hypothetical protein
MNIACHIQREASSSLARGRARKFELSEKGVWDPAGGKERGMRIWSAFNLAVGCQDFRSPRLGQRHFSMPRKRRLERSALSF